MKKFILIIFTAFLLVGCSLNNTPSKRVEEVLKKYQTLDSSVVDNLELITEGVEDLKNSKDREKYTKIMKTQYSDLKYTIKDEKIDGDEATVTVDISVYDYYKIQRDANDYLESHRDEFYTDDVYDEAKFLEYKLKKMMDASDRIEYTIDVNLVKENDKWEVVEFDKDTLEKIHGTYNYKRD